MKALANTMGRWMAMINKGEMEAGPVFRHELAGALTALGGLDDPDRSPRHAAVSATAPSGSVSTYA